MSDKQYSDFFLGANTPSGFRSMFEHSYSLESGWRVIIIKGGPGTGKSTLMRSVAQKASDAGHVVQRIHCSSDPDSLDAVIFPGLRRAIYDGTAPHVLEPVLPGACEQILDLGQAWDAGLLHSRREDIAEYSRLCSGCHRNATIMLACADVFRARLREQALQHADHQKISRAAQRLSERFGLSRRSSVRGSVSTRLASAVTPDGIINVSRQYINSFASIVPIIDRTCAISGLLLSGLRDRLLENGYNLIECPCSQDHSRIEHLLVPDADICFTTRSDAHGNDEHMDNDRRAVHSERFLPESITRGRHPDQLADRREMLRFTGLAADCMRQAKAIHDQLEACYKDAVDFSAVDFLAERAAETILG